MNNVKHVIFMLGSYEPNSSPNGNCCKKIIQKLVSFGYLVDCIANRNPGLPKVEKIDGVTIHRIPLIPSYKYREKITASKNSFNKLFYKVLLTFSYLLEKILFLPFYPSNSPLYVRSFARMADSILIGCEKETIVCVNMPPDTILAGIALKKKHPSLKLVTYLLDPFLPNKSNPFASFAYHHKKKSLAELDIVTKSDLVIPQLEQRGYFDNLYPRFLQNIHYLGVPLLENNIDSKYRIRSSDRIFVFAGSISESYRNPSFIIKAFDYCKKSKLLMYISNDYGWLKPFLSELKTHNVEINGKIDRTKLFDIYKSADGFVNIGNIFTSYAPSKIIEYIGYGRMIISSFRVQNDSSIAYMNKYPYGLSLDERKLSYEEAAQLIDNFHPDIVSPQLQFSYLSELFRANTVDAFIDLCF